MIHEDLRSLLRAQPFRPFTVHVADGTAVQVHHHDYAWVLPSGGEIYVEDRKGNVHFISTAQIAQISYQTGATTPTPSP